jgi:hypothetical protein
MVDRISRGKAAVDRTKRMEYRLQTRQDVERAHGDFVARWRETRETLGSDLSIYCYRAFSRCLACIQGIYWLLASLGNLANYFHPAWRRSEETSKEPLEGGGEATQRKSA